MTTPSLEDFISTSLRDIIAGVKRAQDSVRQYGGRVNAFSTTMSQFVEFDLAVAAVETEKVGGGFGVTVLGMLGAGAQGSSQLQNSATNRIKFKVAVELPTDEATVARPLP